MMKTRERVQQIDIKQVGGWREQVLLKYFNKKDKLV